MSIMKGVGHFYLRYRSLWALMGSGTGKEVNVYLGTGHDSYLKSVAPMAHYLQNRQYCIDMFLVLPSGCSPGTHLYNSPIICLLKVQIMARSMC